jgi:hypothetical protein
MRKVACDCQSFYQNSIINSFPQALKMQVPSLQATVLFRVVSKFQPGGPSRNCKPRVTPGTEAHGIIALV